MDQMDIQEVLRYLPHRYPFLLIDKVIHLDLTARSLIAVKNVTFNEPFFAGHFPEVPVMPGVLIIEALAQASGILYYKTLNTAPNNTETINYLVGINEARFKQVVKPGDQLHLHVELQKVKQGLSKFQCKALVNDELVCSAEIMNVAKDIQS